MAFRIIRNDITKVAADVIVNSANPKPVCGGSTEAIIYEAAGYDDLLEARQGVGYLEVGQVGVTPAFNLMAKSIVHVSCPWWNDGANESVELLRKCYREVLMRATELEAKSVAIPLLSSGVYRFPKDVALQIASEVCGAFNEYEMDIILVVYDQQAFDKAKELFPNVEDLLQEKPVVKELAMLEKISRKISAPSLEAPALADKKPSSLPKRMFRVCKEIKTTKPADDICYAVDSSHEKPSFPKVLEGYTVSKKPKLKAASICDQDAVHKEIDAAIMAMDDDTFQDKLNFYLDRYHSKSAEGLDKKKDAQKNAEVYRAANINRKLFSKIKQEGYRPSKNTVLALAVGLRLNLSETEDFLSRAGYAFSPISRADAIYQCCMRQKDFYKIEHFISDPIDRLNDILHEYQEETIGEAI